ncbi:MAG: hypothetical protein EXX96DRAFT_320842 [Benjaminiella poitrasii]|nr:MAG: hypothetical protein EXX96DRAFT_320842 [Benjaminiella poitrasii]
MHKAAILNKKRSVYERRQALSLNDTFADVQCIDCGEHGYYTKKFSECNLYKPENADQVGTSRKRKQPDNVKREKKLAKRKKVTDEKEVECKRCKMPGHSTARSPQCPFNILPKSKVMDQNLGQEYMAYTRKIPFGNCVHDAYMYILKTKIITTCRDIRHIILRAKIFVNYSTLYDVRRLSLPRLSSVLPSPTYHWRFITISANALSAFLPGQSLPRGYVDQLQLFYTVFKFHKLRFRR